MEGRPGRRRTPAPMRPLASRRRPSGPPRRRRKWRPAALARAPARSVAGSRAWSREREPNRALPVRARGKRAAERSATRRKPDLDREAAEIGAREPQLASVQADLLGDDR